MGISRGTPDQLLNAVKTRIAELGGGADTDIESATNITATTFPVQDVLDFLASKGYDIDDPGVQNYAEGVAEYMDMSREAYERQDMEWPYDLDQWYEDTKLNYPGNLEELAKVDDIECGTNSCNVGEQPDILDEEDVYSAADDKLAEEVTYDTVYAGEDEDFSEDEDLGEVEDIDDNADTIEAAEDDDADDNPDFDMYITELADDVSNAIEQDIEVTSIDWDNDEDNLYITVVINDDIQEFTVPYADLKQDNKTDVDYIVSYIKDELS